MALTWELDLFRSRDAEGVVELYRAVYGDNYPVKAVYDPQALIRQEDAGEAWRAVVRAEVGSVVGHVSFYRSSPPNPGLYEFGQLMVRHDFRQTVAATELMVYSLAEIPRLHALEQIWGEAVCNHLYTQQFVAREGFVETGLEVGLMPGESYSKALSTPSTDKERVSTLLAFRSFLPRAQTLYLPPVYEESLRFIYEPIDCGHTFLVSEAPLPAGIKSQATLREFAGAGVARMTFEAVGEDFESRLAEMESEASAGGAVVTQVFFRLTEPWTGAAVEILRRRGYFLSGALPRWFDDDGLLMQKVRGKTDFEKIFIYSKRARKLKEIVRQDQESVQDITVGGILARMARLLPDKTAMIFAQRNRRYTYAELDREADRVARALIALGVEQGEHVAIWAPNVPEYQLVALGCGRAGAPLVMINTYYGTFELEYVLKQSDTTTLFLTDGAGRPGEYLEALREVRTRLPELRNVILLGDAAPPEMITWQEFLANASETDEARISARKQEISASDIFAIQYTSGTTGAPKGVMLSHFSYILCVDSYVERKGLKSDDILCNPLPFFHVYGNAVSLSALVAGGTVVVLERFRAPDLLQAVETCRVTSISGTPTMFVAALEEFSNRTYDLSSLRGGDMGGSFCPQELVRAVVEKMGARGFGILYGSTEGLLPLLNAPAFSVETRVGSEGKAMPSFDVKICDLQTGKEMSVGENGELCIRGPAMMTRYYKMEEETAAAIDAEGWLHSGDLANVDANGFYHITGRIKEVIIRGGENIYPAEVEAFLLTHPKVLDAQVVGIPCDYYGEDVVAFLRLKQGQSAEVIEMKRYCRENIAINKVPAMVFFVEQYPLTASGKVQKFKLREMAVRKIAEA